MEIVSSWIKSLVFSELAIATAIIVPVAFLIEMIRPARSIPRNHYRFGFVLCFLNTLIFVALTPLITLMTATGANALGLGLIDLTALGFGGIAGAIGAMLFSTLILDFFQYWYHRLLHASRVLWQIHLLHHSDEHMNVMTAQRAHFFEPLLAPVFVTVPMAVLFKLPPVMIAMLVLVPYMYTFLAHANIRLSYGRFWWALVSPDYHRIHHWIEPKHRDKNFANWFPVWDIVFGTCWRPQPGECPQCGLADVRIATLFSAYTQPITGWHKLFVRRPSARAQSARTPLQPVKGRPQRRKASRRAHRSSRRG